MSNRIGVKLLLAQRGNRTWVRNISSRIGVKLLLPEGGKDF